MEKYVVKEVGKVEKYVVNEVGKVAKSVPDLFWSLQQPKLFKCVIDSVIINIGRNKIGAVFDGLKGIPHGNGGVGKIHHLKIIWSISDRNRIFPAGLDMIEIDLHSGCFMNAVDSDLTGITVCPSRLSGTVSKYGSSCSCTSFTGKGES